MIHTSNSWGVVIPSVTLGTRQSATFGAAVTPNQNDIANATYAELIDGALVTVDCLEIEIFIHAVATNAAARDCLVTIGIDPAAGTSYVDTISNLVCGMAATPTVGQPGVAYKFPLRVHAGSSIAAKASVNTATLTDIYVYCVLRGKPSHPELVRAGSFVDTFGATTASSNGTSITSGTTSRGSYVQLGSATTKPYWFLEFGYGTSDDTVNLATVAVDVAHGDATNKKIAIQEGLVFKQNNERLSKSSQGVHSDVATGDLIYARTQSSNTLDDNESIAVYAVGG